MEITIQIGMRRRNRLDYSIYQVGQIRSSLNVTQAICFDAGASSGQYTIFERLRCKFLTILFNRPGASGASTQGLHSRPSRCAVI